MKKTITLIVAMGRNRAIGLEGRLPWHLPAELQQFKRLTMGKPIVMGRKTWEAIGRPLPGRQNIIVTRSGVTVPDGVVVAGNLEAALGLAEGPEIMIIGGGQIYRAALPLASRMVLTLVDCAPKADTWFPEWPEAEWRVTRSQRFEADEHNALAWEVRELERVSVSAP